MIHSIWAGRDGAPLGIRSVAQRSDGILWIASVKGLYSFDGLSFVPFRPAPGSPQLPTRSLRLVFPSKSGDLWGAAYHGPAFQIHQGQVLGFGRSDEPINAIDYLQQDLTDAMSTVVNDHVLVRLDADGS